MMCLRATFLRWQLLYKYFTILLLWLIFTYLDSILKLFKVDNYRKHNFQGLVPILTATRRVDSLVSWPKVYTHYTHIGLCMYDQKSGDSYTWWCVRALRFSRFFKTMLEWRFCGFLEKWFPLCKSELPS